MTKTICVCDRCKKEVSHLYDMPRLILEGLLINVYPSKVELCAECAKQACDGFNRFSPGKESEIVHHARWINDTYCSYCKRFPVDVSVSISNQQLTKYFSRCPHCGSKMDAKDGGDEND